MDKSIKTSLCNGLRACGIPKGISHQVQNTIEKWYDSNGPEWTLKRIKDLRQWYETSLTGEPKPAEWFRHGKDNLPLGVWKSVFKLPIAKALGVLSAGTVLYEKRISETQQKKFLHGIQGNHTQDLESLRSYLLHYQPRLEWKRKPKKMPDITFPTIFDMNGSIPVHDGRSTMRPNENLGLALKALEESWASLPQVTFDFLDRNNLLGYMPVGVIGNDYALDLNRPHSKIVGRIGVIQEPELKARVVANPNRVTQVTLDPLKEVLMSLVHSNPTDCIFDQEEGMRWVQDQLKQGIELAGSDLTSASDLLDLDGCLELLEHTYGLTAIEGYSDYIRYFREVSRSEWYCPFLDRSVKWEQGDPLGTGPSIGILSEANSCSCNLALLMAKEAGVVDSTLLPRDAYRVLGDDVIMRSELEPFYNRVIECLGGEINHSKTLKSNKVAEFAGRIVTQDQVFLKKIKYCEPSDDSFMEYMRQLGDQAKFFLKPKQRKVYEFYRHVPGYINRVLPPKGWEDYRVSGGTWMEDSYGESLGDRYSWYLTEVKPVLDRVRPDIELVDYDSILLKAELANAEAGIASDDRQLAEPSFDEGYLPSQVEPNFRKGGDPRLTHGQSTLVRLASAMRHILPFGSGKTKTISSDPLQGGETVSSILTDYDQGLNHPGPNPRTSGRDDLCDNLSLEDPSDIDLEG